ncbi:PadR family transcriptional regulator [Brevibacterium casei]|uniref:PadR family transcriptional regulator n=1 Tax=Brevibacterium casei TaxID=33889 RepID=A0A7T2THL3_9MICO|nr:PadR family transcriptional regulator [Brevibacterium casei]QPS34012.1 PadR family transcriptional regulator [Brevibacterium casei]
MSLRSAILAVLRIGPTSGYELQKLFSQSVGYVWHAPDSQIYPELRKMADRGLIVAEEQTRGTAGTRKVYHVTDSGDEEFVDWMNSPLKYQRIRDAAHLRAAYLESADAEAVEEFLTSHIEHWQKELDTWEGEIAKIDSLTSPMLNRRLEVTADEKREATIAFKRYSYEGLAARARGEIRWAREGLALAKRLGITDTDDEAQTPST